MNNVRVLHFLNSIIGIAIGLYCLFCPESAATSLGIALTHPSAFTDFRATYGGMTLALGVFFGLAFLGKTDSKSAVLMGALFYAGLGLTRIVGLFIDRPQIPMMYGFACAEVIFLIWSILMLRKGN